MQKESYGWILTAIILLLVVSSLSMGGHMVLGMGFGFVLMIIFWAAVIWLVFSIVGNEHKAKPLEIVKKRYASGEISRKEFEKLKKEIQE